MRISDWSSDVCSSDLHEQNSRDQHASHDDGIVALAHGLVDPAADARAGAHALGEDRRGDEVTDADAENGARRKHGDRPRIAEGATTLRKAEGASRPDVAHAPHFPQPGRASCRESGCQYVSISWVAR